MSFSHLLVDNSLGAEFGKKILSAMEAVLDCIGAHALGIGRPILGRRWPQARAPADPTTETVWNNQTGLEAFELLLRRFEAPPSSEDEMTIKP